MKVKTNILLIFIVFVFMSSFCTLVSGDNICFFGAPHCFGSPSGWCVIDEVTNNVIQYCAVGCYEVPGPVGGAFCTYGPFECRLYPGIGRFTCWDGATPTVRCAVAKWVNYENLSDCWLQCATACGRRTLLSDDCENCTKFDMCSIYLAGSTMEAACNNTCFGVCESNKQFCDVIMLLRYAAMFVGIIMLILHGFKWLVSEDAEGRKDAKRGIAYIMFGLIVIVAASALVELIFFQTIICATPYWWWFTP